MRRRVISRGFVVSSIAAVSLLSSTLPGTASAAVQLGQVSPLNPVPCPPNSNSVQISTVQGLNYQVPIPGGVITSWSHRGGANTTPQPSLPGSGRLQIWDRMTGTANFTLIGRSELETFTAGVVTFLTRISVDPGDRLGLRTVEANTGCGIPDFPSTTGIGSETNAPDPNPGDMRTLNPRNGFRLDVAAVLEPDADADGFGDETQDLCPTDAAIQGPCPPPPASPPTCKGKPATIVGTSGNDVRKGTSAEDVIVGLGGNDKLSGLAGNDLICGRAGKDTLTGGKGNDKLYGKAGKDTLKGGPGKDKLKGGPGKDRQVQ
jgi:hypothetical protein